ncbi:glycosyltransferase family 39 protein [Aggregatilinea lenta]|uniref:glycosyltransferase family 39 protein n=1 Tax=Aggregatilinea lenta TaxID=913108 RepID=UPI000E5ABA23|nr:glycosyltransferase family 39 protein [Aggregatilinea lenta]
MEQTYAVGVSQTAINRPVTAGRWASQARSNGAANVRPWYFLGTALAILLVAFVLRMWNLGGASLWTDEGLSALRAQASLSESFDSILSSGNQTPFYFMLLRLMPNTSEVLLRLPSVLFGLLGVAVLMAVGLRLYKDYHLALWAGALLAVNPYHILLSRTARPYAFIFAMSLLIGTVFLELLRGHRSRGLWITLTVASGVAYLTHYTLLALPAAEFLVMLMLWHGDWAMFKRWVVAQVLACVPVVTWLIVLMNHPVNVGPAWVPTPGLQDVPLTLWSMTIGYDGIREFYTLPAVLIISLGLTFGIYAAFQEMRKNPANLLWFWLITATLAVAFFISAFIISFYVDRYFMMFLPAVLFLTVYGVRRAPRQVANGALAVLSLTALGNILFSFHSGEYQRADYRGAAEFIAREYKPGDAVIIERENVQEVFTRYFEPGSKESPELVLLSNTPDTVPYETTGRRVWVVYRNPNEDIHEQGAMPDFDPLQPGLSPTGDWLVSHRDMILRQRSFNGVTVLELQMGERILAGGIEVSLAQ